MMHAKRDKSDTGKLQEISRGWFIILGAAIGVGVGVSSLPYYTSGIFMIELEGDLGWSRSQLTIGVLLWTLSLAIGGPFIGRIIDKYGVRGPASISLIFLGACFMIMGLYMQHYWQFLVLQVSLSFLGIASTPISFTRIVNSWFNKARGLSLGLTLMGTGVTATFMPRILTGVIEDHGWRGGYMFLSLLIFACVPIVLLLLKPKLKISENVNEIATKKTMLYTANGDVKGVNSSDNYLKSGVFLLLIATFFLLAVAISGLLVHFIPMLLDSGHTKMKAASIAGLIGVSVIFGRMAVGILLDKYFAPYIGVITFGLCSIGCLILLFGTANPIAASIAAIAIGFGMGAEIDLIGYLTVRYFGMKSYSYIYAYQYSGFVLGAGIGPFWIGIVYDKTGGYQLALIISILILLLACFLFLRMPAYRYDN